MSVSAYDDLSALGDALDEGVSLPGIVLLDADSGASPDMLDGAHGVVGGVLCALQDWLSDERFGESRLVVLSTDAVLVRAGDGVHGLAGSGVWGLVRSAQSENPDRFVLIDIQARDGLDDGDDAALGVLLGTALAHGEPQLAIRDEEVLAPRLARAANPIESGEHGETLGLGPDDSVLIKVVTASLDNN
jgi:hypothetical protein